MHSVMSSLEFMQRLAALVPRRRLHLIWFHGVLAPNAKLRALVVPHGPEQATGKLELNATEPGCAHGRPARISWAGLRVGAAPGAGTARCGATKREGLPDVQEVLRSGGDAADSARLRVSCRTAVLALMEMPFKPRECEDFPVPSQMGQLRGQAGKQGLEIVRVVEGRHYAAYGGPAAAGGGACVGWDAVGVRFQDDGSPNAGACYGGTTRHDQPGKEGPASVAPGGTGPCSNCSSPQPFRRSATTQGLMS